MSFLPGLKKQLNKANQFMSEKIGGVEGTKLDEEFMEMERKTDLTAELVEELINKTKEYLQPNPATRSKMMLNARVAQNTRTRNYAQPEGMLGETILRIAHIYGEDSPYVRSLMETGESFKQMAEIKYALEDDVRQDFIEPLTLLQTKDLKEVLFHRKKLQGRRLDFDCKKRRRANGANIEDEEMKIAEEKFEESFNLASQSMHNMLQNDVEQISQLVALVEALRDYYKSCGSILESLADKLGTLRDESAARQHSEFVPKKLRELNNGTSTDRVEVTEPVNHHVEEGNKKCGFCVALYDFQAENAGELGFKEGQTLKLFNQIDENWFEGALDGPDGEQTGIFPTNYVRITQPIPVSATEPESEPTSKGEPNVDWSSTNLLSVGLGTCVYLWSACTSQVTRLCDLSGPDNERHEKVTSVSWSERGNYVAVGCESGMVQVWDVTATKQINTLTGHSNRVGALAWNGDILISGSRDRSILQRDIRTPCIVPDRKLEAHKQEVCGLKWSPDNQNLASGGNDNKLFIWNMHSSQPCQAYHEHGAAVKAIAWSPHHHQILVWKYPSLMQVAKLTGHSQRVLYLATSPDGDSIVTGAGDETLRFWNVFTKTRPRKVSKSALNLFASIR